MEKRIVLELCERTHVYICSSHLPFAHFFNPLVHALLHPFLPFRILVFHIILFFKVEFGVLQVLGILEDFRNDFFAHLLVNLARLTSNEQLHLNGEEVGTEGFFLA